MELTKNEIVILRELGQQYMSLASLPIQCEKMLLWKSLNRFDMQRPMVVIDQLPITELNINGELTCFITNSFWRDVEFELRLSIYKYKYFPVDMVLEPYITIPKAISMSNYGRCQNPLLVV